MSHMITSLPPKTLMYMQHLEAQSGSSLDSEPNCFVQTDFAAQYAGTTTADRKHSITEGKRCFTRKSRQILDVEECSKRSRVESVSGVTFQKDLNLHHVRKSDAESDSASVRSHVGSCHDSVFVNSKRLKLGEIRCNENDVDKHGIHCNHTDVDKDGIRCRETDADIHVTFICSRVQDSSGNLLSIARQGIRENAFSYGRSRDDSHSNSRGSSNTSLTHLGKSEAVSGAPRSSQHVVISPHTSSIESLYAPFLDGDAINTESSPPSYVLSSGRLSLEEGKLWLPLCTVFLKKF